MAFIVFNLLIEAEAPLWLWLSFFGAEILGGILMWTTIVMFYAKKRIIKWLSIMPATLFIALLIIYWCAIDKYLL